MTARLSFYLSGSVAFGVLAILLALALGGCSTVADTRHGDHVRSTFAVGDAFHQERQHEVTWVVPYIAPECRANEAALWALPVEVKRLPLIAVRLMHAVYTRKPNPDVAEFYAPPTKNGPAMIFQDERYRGWLSLDYEMHGRCHAWLDATTGNPEFHR